jgi:hypothetical protein
LANGFCIMSSRRANTIPGQFAPRLIDMLESPAHRELSLSALRLIFRIEVELAHHGGKDNGMLPITFDDFVRFGLHRHAITAAIREAVALGFIKVTRGRAGNAEWRKANLFGLTYRPGKGIYADGSHEWRRIGTEQEAHEIAVTARKAIGKKSESQCRKTPNPSAGNRHRKQPIHSTETVTTSHSAEIITTLDISGRGAASNGAANGSAQPVRSVSDWLAAEAKRVRH